MDFTRRGLLGALLAMPFARKLVAAPTLDRSKNREVPFTFPKEDPSMDGMFLSYITFTSRDPAWRHRIGERVAIAHMQHTYYGYVRQVTVLPYVRVGFIDVTMHNDGNRQFHIPNLDKQMYEVTICECQIGILNQRYHPTYNLEPGARFQLSS